MSAEQTPRATPDIGQLAAQVWNSWWCEWRRLARQGWSTLAPAVPLTRVTFSEREIVIRPASAAGEFRMSTQDVARTGSLASAVREHLGADPMVELHFAESDMLRAQVRLPRAKRNVLEKALYFELARVTPVRAETVYFDCDFSPGSTKQGEVLARLRLIRRDVLDAAVAACHAGGVQVAAIRMGDDREPASWRCFPVDRPAVALVLWRKLKVVSTVGLAVLLTLLLFVAAYQRRERTLSDIEARIAAARPAASESVRLRSKFDRLSKAESLLDAKKEAPLFTYILAQISRTLPTDTWLTGLQVVGSKVRIQGYSLSASRLLSELGGAGFGRVQFDAPVTRDGINKAERFDISFEIQK